MGAMSRAFSAVLGGTALASQLVLSAQAACRPPAERADAKPPPPSPRAQLEGGVIVRDEATLRVIRATVRSGPLPRGPRYDLRLEVVKSRYRLDVIDGEHRIKVYPIALGGAPEGGKEREGDHRTPEGDYVLMPHHSSPKFGECFYVGYPSLADAERALAAGLLDRRGWRRIADAFSQGRRPPYDTVLGGLILIHGTRDRAQQDLTRTNWTDGCIAMENEHLLELLAAFSPADRPLVRIRP